MPGKLIKNAAFLGGVVGDYRLALPLFRVLDRRYPNLARSDTELCVDGFPRSGNSFLVAAIQRWNPDLRLSHHTHLAGNIKFAVKHDIPTVILLRKPVDAVASAMIWDGMITPWVGLFAYTHFYRSVAAFLEKALVVNFEDAVSKPDAVVDMINRKFATGLSRIPFDVSEERKIRNYLVRHDARNDRDATRSTLPNAEKQRLKQSALADIQQCALLERAERLWRDLAPERIES